jgi:hypothetical protein
MTLCSRTVTVYAVKCQICDVIGPEEPTRKTARIAAHRIGWRAPFAGSTAHGFKRIDICPLCVPAYAATLTEEGRDLL